MKRILAMFLILLYMTGSVGCQSSSLPEEMPEDFSFAIRWNTYGISTYDSDTGILVKDTKASDPKEYTADLVLTQEQEKLVYDYIRELNPYSYSDDYEPRGNVPGEPPHPLYLTVRINSTEKQIRVKNFSGTTDKKGELYRSTCNAIIEILESTEEWQGLPEYERFFE